MRTTYFNNKKHINNLINNEYYSRLVNLRNLVEISCDDYFQNLKAKKVDLFLVTQSVSSPTGKGSDSKPINIKFGEIDAFLTDSAQFGMEPLVQNFFKIVYCYLPSFRGENPDNRHLNQFFHCETEMRGTYRDAMKIAENLTVHIIKKVLEQRKEVLMKQDKTEHLINATNGKYPVYTFEEAENTLRKTNKITEYINYRSYGRVITHKGEIKFAELINNNKTPVWIEKYDRDVVPFYQKPDPKNHEVVLNADLIFPSVDGNFGGEIIGLGQRQDKVEELIESISRQKIKDSERYDWYLKIREIPKYQKTSGFGLGIERFLSWILQLDNIIDTSLFPVLKGIKTDY